MNLRNCALAMIFTLLSATTFADDITSKVSQEIDSYINKLDQTEDADLYDLVNFIRFSGLSDKRLFDKIEKLVKSKHQHLIETGSEDDITVIQVKILIMALASSGDSSYWVTLDTLVRSSIRNVRNRAHESLRNIGFYNERNRIMQHYDSLPEGQSLQSKRTLNLLQSDKKKHSRYAAEDIHRVGIAEPVVLEWIATQLEQKIHLTKDKVGVDMLAWYCKALAKVDKKKYTPLLRKIIEDKSIDSKIRKHAKKALNSN